MDVELQTTCRLLKQQRNILYLDLTEQKGLLSYFVDIHGLLSSNYNLKRYATASFSFEMLLPEANANC